MKIRTDYDPKPIPTRAYEMPAAPDYPELPAQPDLLDLAAAAGELSLSLHWLGRGLAQSYEDDGEGEQTRARKVALGTLEQIRQGVDRLIGGVQVDEARTLLRRAINTERHGMMYRHWLSEAALALDRAGLAHFVPIVDDALDRIGGTDSELEALLAELGG